MATDSTHLPSSDDVATTANQEFNPEVVQVAAADTAANGTPPAQGQNQAQNQAPVIPGVANGTVQVQVPAGQTVVRVQVAPGETIDLPFDGSMAAKFGQQGNLAIKLGDQTIILLGYAQANQQSGVTVKDDKGHPIDVASVVAQTDPNLDIQTAAGPAAGPAGAQGGHLFFGFAGAGGLGGFGELGVINPTELQYQLIQPDEKILIVGDTQPTISIISIDNGGNVNEDDLGRTPSKLVLEESFSKDGGQSLGGSDIHNPDFLQQLADHGFGNAHFGKFHTGNDPYDTGDHEDGSQTGGAFPDDTGDPDHIDQDREPLTVKAHIQVNFFADVPGHLTFVNPITSDNPVIDYLVGKNLTSHDHALQYQLLPADGTHGETVIAFYTTGGGETETPVCTTIVFSLEIVQAEGTTSISNFDLAFTIYGVLDNPEMGSGTAGEIPFDLPTGFFAVDSDGSVTASPPGNLVYHDIDDVPELGHYTYSSTWCPASDGHGGEWVNIPTGYQPANLTIGLDESHGVQHTPYTADANNDHGGSGHDNGDIDPTGSLGQHSDQTTDDVCMTQSDANAFLKGVVTSAENSDNSEASLENHIDHVLDKIDPSYLVNPSDPACGINTFLGAAQVCLDVSFGADGKAIGNSDQEHGETIHGHAGATLFDLDNSADKATAFELYMQEGATGAPDGSKGNAPVDCQLTNVWISVDDGTGHVTLEQVTAYQLDANTVIGLAPGLPQEVPSLVADVATISSGNQIPVFMLHLDPQSGELTLIQYHQVNNPEPCDPNDPIQINDADGNPLFHFRATDFDGDYVDAPLSVAIIDDAPRICPTTYCNGSNEVDEDFLSASTNGIPGNHDKDTNPNSNLDHPYGDDNNGDGPGGTHVGGQINATGVDVPLAYAFHVSGLHNDGDTIASFTDDAGHTVKSSDGHDVALTLHQDGTNWVITGAYTDDSDTSHEVFKLTLDSYTGKFDFCLEGALQHPDTGPGPVTRYEDNLLLDFGIKVTDVDGDKVYGSGDKGIQINVDDDAPRIVCAPEITSTETGCCDQDTQPTNLPQLDSIDQREGDNCLQESTCSVTIDTNNVPGWVTIAATDDQGNPGATVDTTTGAGFGVSSDTDGTGNARFHEINFDDTGGVGGTGGSESLIFNFGKLVESGTAELARFFSDEQHVGNETGHWAAYRGGVLVGEGDFTADSTTGLFGLAIPTVAGGFDQLVFTGLPGTSSGGGQDESDFLVQQLHLNLLPCNTQAGKFDYAFGADNGNLPHDGQPGNGFTVNYTGDNLTSGGAPVTIVQSIDGTHVIIEGFKNGDTNEPVFKMDIDPGTPDSHGVSHATYTFNEYAPLDNNGGDGMSHLPFDIQIMDRDGDAIHTSINVCIDDSAPVVDTTCATVFEKGLDQSGTDHDGTAKGDGSNITQGFLNFSYNGDGPGHITGVHFQGFGGTPSLGTQDAVDDGSGNWKIDNAAFTLLVDQITGHYTFTLHENFTHDNTDGNDFTNADGNSGNYFDYGDLLQNLGFDVTVQDGDGSVTTGIGALNVKVTDDGPIAVNDDIGSFAENSGDHNLGNAYNLLVASNDKVGADGYMADSLTVVGTGSLGGTLSIDGAGDLHYTPPHNVNNPGGDPVTETFNYTFQDSDGDPATAQITVAITDTGPCVFGYQACATVDEDGLSGGIAGGPTDHVPDVVHNQPDEAHWQGHIGFNYGNDGPGDIALSVTGDDTGLTKLDGTAVHTVWDAGTHTLIGYGTDQTTDQVFTLHITDTSTGDYTLTLLQPVKHPTNDNEDNVSFNVNIAVTDSDGSTASGAFEVKINDDTPVAAATLSEGGIVNIDETPGPQYSDHVGGSDPFGGAYGTPIEWATGGSAVVSPVGTVFGADGPAASDAVKLGVSPSGDGVDSGLTDTATNSHIYLYQDGDNVVGKVGGSGGAVAFAISIDTTGHLTVAEYLAIHHPDKTDPNDSLPLAQGSLNATVTATDGDGDKSIASVDASGHVRFFDDGPTANPLTVDISASSTVDTNLQIVLDVSGSMGDNAAGLTLVSKLLAAKEAIYQLLDAYENAGDVKVQLITFSTGASTQFSTWVDGNDLKHLLFTLAAGGTTNYDAPLAQAMLHAWAGDHSSGQFNAGTFQNVSYFLSDGLPNVAGGVEGTPGITGTEITNWTGFLDAHNIDSFAFGMGSGAVQSALNPIAYDGQTHTDKNATIVTDFSTLPTALVNTVIGSAPIHLMTDGGNTPGTDKANSHVSQIVVDGKTYNFDGATLSTLATPVTDYTFNSLTHELTVNSVIGQLIVDLDTGDGHFNATAPAGADDTFNYVLTDGDGDSAGNTLHLTVSSTDHAPVGYEDYIVTNASGDITVKDAWLLHNDKDADGDPLSVSAVHSGTTLAVLDPGHIGTDTTVHHSETVFNYNVTANGQEDDLNFVSVDHQSGSTLKGNGLDNILIGADGQNNTLIGYEGNDVYVGGNQADTYQLGAGHNLIDMTRGGPDTAQFTKLVGSDVIDGFTDHTGGSNADHLDFSAVLSGFGTEAQRSTHVNVSNDGTDTTVKVDTDNNLATWEINVTLHGTTAALTVGAAGTNDVIV